MTRGASLPLSLSLRSVEAGCAPAEFLRRVVHRLVSGEDRQEVSRGGEEELLSSSQPLFRPLCSGPHLLRGRTHQAPGAASPLSSPPQNEAHISYPYPFPTHHPTHSLDPQQTFFRTYEIYMITVFCLLATVVGTYVVFSTIARWLGACERRLERFRRVELFVLLCCRRCAGVCVCLTVVSVRFITLDTDRRGVCISRACLIMFVSLILVATARAEPTPYPPLTYPLPPPTHTHPPTEPTPHPLHPNRAPDID